MTLVLDSVVVLALLLPNHEHTEYCRAAIDYVAEHGGVIPYHAELEIQRVLIESEWAGRITREERHSIDLAIRELPLWTARVPSCGLPAFQDRELNLSQAIYLAVAGRHGAPLATLDPKLAAAAHEAYGHWDAAEHRVAPGDPPRGSPPDRTDPKLPENLPTLIAEADAAAQERYAVFLQGGGLKDTTCQIYARAVHRFLGWCDDRLVTSLDEIDEDRIKQYLREVAGSSPSMVPVARAAIKALMATLRVE